MEFGHSSVLQLSVFGEEIDTSDDMVK